MSLSSLIIKKENVTSIAIISLTSDQYSNWLAEQTDFIKKFLQANDYRCEKNQFILVPKPTGEKDFVLIHLNSLDDFWAFGRLPLNLPEGLYQINNFAKSEKSALAWCLGAYQFTRYKKVKRIASQLLIDEQTQKALLHLPAAIYLVRDMVNTPAEDMTPQQIAYHAKTLAEQYQAEFKQIVGEDLLKHRLNAIHTVGRASYNPPQLIEINYGSENHPKITLVGKGVCFDSGGLDIKPSSGMLLMKKDMGGAAHVLGLAQLIMANELPVRLRVLIPAVENAISANAYRPGDVITGRKGLSIEIGNTDAEGRVVLSDALALAVEENPDLIIDFATLTGAAKVALGPDIPAMFYNNDELAMNLWQISKQEADLVWPMPLYEPMLETMKSSIADINNMGTLPLGGALSAAIFLKQFIDNSDWLHFDFNAWNIVDKPGRPAGGEAMGLRAVFAFIRQRYS